MGDSNVSTRQEGLLLIVILLLVSFIFQLQMKLLANDLSPILKLADQGGGQKLVRLAELALSERAWLIAALAATLFSVWLLTLTRLELSAALPLASVALVVNAVGVGFMLGESLSPMRIAGIVTVAIGIILVLKT
jgi:multidrug transporter EmrE-like cation transporter